MLAGQILRRQLLVLLKEKVWETQMYGNPLSVHAKDEFLTSFYVMASVDLQAETQRVCGVLTPSELDSPIDLRSFYDPAPLVVSSLAPLSVVYRLFNELGVLQQVFDVAEVRALAVRADQSLLLRRHCQRAASSLPCPPSYACSALPAHGHRLGHLLARRMRQKSTLIDMDRW